MLKKLLKYDLENIFKFIVIFYILSIFFAILTRILFSIENSFILNILGQITSGITISMLFNILINNLMRLWVRFKQNLYGDESYLTHTLPVKKQTIYLSKTITSIITTFTSVVVIGITLFIAYYSKENIELLKQLLLPLVTTYESTMLTFILLFLFIFFLEFSNILQAGYTGILIGHKKNNNKILFSLIYGFIAYLIIQMAGLITIFITAIFNDDIMNLFFTNEIINIGTIKIIIYMSIILYSLTLIINYIFNLKIFKQGVNVD